MIVAARNEDSNVYSIARGAIQCFDLRWRWSEIRRRDPDGSSRRDGLNLECSRNPQPQRFTLDDADERRAIGRRIEVGAARRSPEKAMRAAPLVADRATPHIVERLDHIAGRHAFDLHRGIAPA